MRLCPIAVVAGCRKCPAFSICPLKGVIGDYSKSADAPLARPPASPHGSTAAKRGAGKR
jgi:hypothetical protein